MVRKIRFLSALSVSASFLVTALLTGVSALPGGYLLLWGFREFLLDSVFTGELPPILDMVLFCSLLGLAALLWGLSLLLLLGIVLRASFRFSLPGELRQNIEDLAERTVLPLLPFSWGHTLFRSLSGKN